MPTSPALLGALLLAAAPVAAQSTNSRHAPCDTVLASASVMATAQHQFRLRHASPAARFPWTDTLPPRIVTDASVCRAAARAYLSDSLPTLPDSALAAGVVLAGGLYFAQAWPLRRGGEFVVIAVLDRTFRWLVGLAN